MLLHLVLIFLASTSASEPVGCTKKTGGSLYKPESPVTGKCEETGLGWTGRNIDSIDKKDQFFTKWTDFFLQPDCVDKIFVHIGENDKLIETKDNFGQIDVTGQNPSNTVLITNQTGEEICKLRKGFTSRLVFVPKFYELTGR